MMDVLERMQGTITETRKDYVCQMKNIESINGRCAKECAQDEDKKEPNDPFKTKPASFSDRGVDDRLDGMRNEILVFIARTLGEEPARSPNRPDPGEKMDEIGVSQENKKSDFDIQRCQTIAHIPLRCLDEKEEEDSGMWTVPLYMRDGSMHEYVDGTDLRSENVDCDFSGELCLNSDPGIILYLA